MNKDLEIKDLDIKLDGTDVDYYNDAATYWKGVDCTINGMLGGFGKITDIDIDSSNKLLKLLFKLENAPGHQRALDCGAGIGRISKHLLTKHFDQVDLVEQNRLFLEKAKDYLKDTEQAGTLYCCGLQNFIAQECHYDVIWCQWVLGHLTDAHLIEFFKRCLNGLKPNGFIVVKENLTSSGETEMDQEDSSVTRPLSLLKEIFSKAGMEIVQELDQKKMPKGLYPVKMFALQRQMNK